MTLVLGEDSPLVSAQMARETRAALGDHPRQCGWTGLNIRPFPRATVSEYQPRNIFLLRYALGGCQEYASKNDGAKALLSLIHEYFASSRGGGGTAKLNATTFASGVDSVTQATGGTTALYQAADTLRNAVLMRVRATCCSSAAFARASHSFFGM
jgi:hypothetical protein